MSADRTLEAIAEQLRRNRPAARPVAPPPCTSTGTGQELAELGLICAADVEPEAIRWLWPGWLAAGKLAILAGAPGTGKTTLALGLAATITTEGRWPDRTPCRERGSVLVWSGEDDARDTLIPRLMAAGAERSRVRFLDHVKQGGRQRAFDPAQDIPLIAAAMEMLGDVRLLIIDPIVSAVRGDSHKAAEVRRSLQPIVDYAMKHRCAVLGITHFAKGTSGGNPLERVIGSQAFGALARIVLVAAKAEHSDGGRVLARAKSNIGPDDGGVGYTLEQVVLPSGVHTSVVKWGSLLTGSAREILGEVEMEEADQGSALERAMAFLQEILAAGPVAKNKLDDAAREAGHTRATLLRAKNKLGLHAIHPAIRGPWYWKLPDSPPKALNTVQDAHSPGMSTLGELEHLGGLGAPPASTMTYGRHRE